MKPIVVVLMLMALARGSFASTPNAEGRMLKEINVIPERVLQRSVSPKFFKSLTISPIAGWVVVRASLVGTHLAGARVIHSELNGAYDAMALKLAKEAEIAGYYSIEKRMPPSVLLHLLVYNLADGTMALSFVHCDDPGDTQMEYYGCAKLAVRKGEGAWTWVKGPESLEGNGVAVRQGMKNNLKDNLKLEGMHFGAEATNMGP